MVIHINPGVPALERKCTMWSEKVTVKQNSWLLISLFFRNLSCDLGQVADSL